jgi:hypothetical protein
LKNTTTICLYLVFSVIAVVLILLLVGTTPSQSLSLPLYVKAGVASVFILCCGIGISFTLRPNWIQRAIPGFQNKEKNTQHRGERSFQGHHPECPSFKNHTIRWKEKTLCAGCLGLFIGLFAAIVLMILYMLTDIQLIKMMSYLLLLLGLFILAIVYVEILHRSRHATVHVFINSMLPLSFFLITISVVAITGKIIDGLFTILLCFLWLDTRIHISKWQHSHLCTHCDESCKMFSVPV